MLENFVLKLITGITLIWVWMPRKEVTDGFFRIQMLVALGLCVLAALSVQSEVSTANSSSSQTRSPRTDPSVEIRRTSDTRTSAVTQLIRLSMILAAAVSYVGHIVWKLGRRVPGAVAIYSVTVLCLVSQVAKTFSSGFSWYAAYHCLSSLTSATVLGATLTGMLLGHWYLTTPTMSIAPLSWFTRALILTAVGRLVITILSLLQFGFESHDLVHLIWLTVRIAGGILVPFATAAAVTGILKLRNTQSATGVLFAALILVFMGEMSGALLERDLGITY